MLFRSYPIVKPETNPPYYNILDFTPQQIQPQQPPNITPPPNVTIPIKAKPIKPTKPIKPVIPIRPQPQPLQPQPVQPIAQPQP